MSHATPSEAEVVNTLASLKISPNSKTKAKPKSTPVADSWDDDISSGSDTETETEVSSNANSLATTTSSNLDSLSPINTTSTEDPPNPPPPTPASPTPFDYPDNTPFGRRSRGNSAATATAPERRPEKTTAVAGRLIAGALGVRAPRRTEEEREYDRAMRENQKKKREEERNREKAEREKAEERKRAIWED